MEKNEEKNEEKQPQWCIWPERKREMMGELDDFLNNESEKSSNLGNSLSILPCFVFRQFQLGR